MKISIGAHHFENAKSQAYSIREKLLATSAFNSLESIYTKSSFLNTWAYCLGYRDWGEFQAITKKANRDCKLSLVITPENIENLARQLMEKSYFHTSELPTFEAILYQSAFDDEKKLFSKEDIDYFNHWSVDIGTESHPVILELGPDPYDNHLVEMLFDRFSSLPVKEAEKELLAYAKKSRCNRGLKKKVDIKMYNLDVYPKSGRRAQEIINSCISNEWIEQYTSFDANEKTERFRLTSRAINWLYMSGTMDYCKDWLDWNKDVDRIFSSSLLERNLEGKHSRLTGFINEETPSDYVQGFLYDKEPNSRLNCIHQERAKNWRQLIDTSINQYLPESDNIFHVYPKLFLTYGELNCVAVDDLSLNVELEFMKQSCSDKIESTGEVHILPGWKLLKPFPNKRYISAQLRGQHLGEFVRIPRGAEIALCTLTWHDQKRGITLKHRIVNKLEYIKGNHFFSPDHSAVYRNNSNAASNFPSSFFDLNAVRCAATNMEELKQVSRFVNQIEQFDRQKGEISIRETINIPSGALATYHSFIEPKM